LAHATVHGLAQGFQDRAVELGHLVQEQHALVVSETSPGRACRPPPTISAIEVA
jgi:hypothetical protein